MGKTWKQFPKFLGNGIWAAQINFLIITLGNVLYLNSKHINTQESTQEILWKHFGSYQPMQLF